MAALLEGESKSGSYEDSSSDLAAMWQSALTEYDQTVGEHLAAMPRYNNLADIEMDRTVQQNFEKFRHKGGNIDKLRSLIASNSTLIVQGATYVANAASAAFPPSAAILTALTLVMKASDDVSKDYDKITSFFDELNTFLNRLSMLEGRMPKLKGYKDHLMRVFAAILVLLGLTRKAVKEGRLKRFGKTILRGGGDGALSDAAAVLDKNMKRLESATSIAVLAGVQDTQTGIRDVKSSTQRVEDRSNQIYEFMVTQGSMVQEQFQAMSANWDRLYAQQKSREQTQTVGATSQVNDPGLRKLAAFNFINAVFPDKNSPASHRRDIQRAFVKGTAEWILQVRQLIDWKASATGPSMLWISGPAGCGKSHLAYSIHEDLKLTTASDSDISVVGIHLKDYLGDEDGPKGMLCSMLHQMATRDAGYCEKMAAKLDPLGVNWIVKGAIATLWNMLIVDRFQKDSTSQLFLIMDGVDECEDTQDFIVDIMEQIVESELRIRVLVTSRPSWDHSSEVLRRTMHKFQISQQDTRHDMRRFIESRIISSSRLNRYRKQIKRLFSSQVLARSNSMLYAEHMLLLLDNVHREDVLLKEVKNMPEDLNGLFRRLTEAIHVHRRPQQVVALRSLLAWLAFSNRSLTIADANAVLRLHLDDRFFDFEEELSGASGQILDIVNMSDDLERDNESDTGDHLSDAPEDDQPADDSGNQDLVTSHDEDDSRLVIRFRSRSIRDFFRSESQDGYPNPLVSHPDQAHAEILEMCVNLLCSAGCSTSETNTQGSGEALLDYAAANWAYHFEKIDRANLSDSQVAKVLHSIRTLLTNTNDVTAVIEKRCGQHTTYDSVNTWAESRYDRIQVALPPWLEQGATLAEELLGEDLAWVQALASNPKLIMVDFARGHTKNWIQNFLGFVKSFGLGLEAFMLADILDIEPSADDDPELFLFSPASLTRIVSLSGNVLDWKAYRSIAMVLLDFMRFEDAFMNLELALQHAQTDSERAEVLTILACTGYRKLQTDYIRSRQEAMAQVATTNYSGSSSGRLFVTVVDDEIAKDWDYYREKAELAVSLFPTSDRNKHQRQMIRQCVSIVAVCNERLGRTAAALQGYQDARSAAPDEPVEASFLLSLASYIYAESGYAEVFQNMLQWNFFELMTWMCTAFLDEITVSHPLHHLELLYQGARAAHNLEFVERTWEAIIQYQETRGLATQACHRFALFLLTVWPAGKEASERAKALLYKILRSKSQRNPVTGINETYMLPAARDGIAETIYEQFRSSHDVAAKKQLLQEMRTLQEDNVNVALTNIDPEESSTAIIYALMLRKVGSNVECEQVLDQAFQSCIEALSDADGGNDRASLLLLAKVLGCTPGLGRDAGIAYSAQYSILVQEIALTGPDGTRGILRDPNLLTGGLSYGDVELEPLIEGGEPVIATTDEDGWPIAQRYQYKSHEQWGDILPCKYVHCDGHRHHKIVHWNSSPTYLCITCTDVQLCQECYDTIQSVNRDQRSWDDLAGARYCGRDHRYIKGPIRGWKGVRNGYIVIDRHHGAMSGGSGGSGGGGDINGVVNTDRGERENESGEERILFRDWLSGLESRWHATWKEFWRNEDIPSVLD